MSSTNSSSSRTFVLASRASQLAQVQTFSVRDTLKSLYADSTDATRPAFTTSFMTTAGDKNQSQALYLLGGKALWTKELEVALKEKGVDLLVHCLKDVPTTLPEGCLLAAILEREDPVDSLVVKAGKPWKSLDDLPAGSVVGTSSVRRVAQLKRKYPHLQFMDSRGNLYVVYRHPTKVVALPRSTGTRACRNSMHLTAHMPLSSSRKLASLELAWATG
ncbi:hypothetical protein NMY22_g19806 [Coprinellus aureogranulatus]|nr:hypothetical protein NMY22_g19806 [Coprinellus aureogranulatus]